MDSDCNRNEKENSKKQLEVKSKKNYLKMNFKKQNILGSLQREQGKEGERERERFCKAVTYSNIILKIFKLRL